jgi:uncharacterized protein (TIGR00369 family)
MQHEGPNERAGEREHRAMAESKPKGADAKAAGIDQIPGDKRAFFQEWFSDRVPHNAALATEILAVSRGKASMRLDWAPQLVGNPDTGVLAGGAITALLDSCSGASVATLLTEPVPFATLDLRIDYLRPAKPNLPVIAEAECFRLTSNVAFTRAIAHQGDAKDPVAASAGTFMIGTKGAALPGSAKEEMLAGAARTARTKGSKGGKK